MLQRLLQRLLRLLARSVLLMYEPTIIGVTGSVGKTSTKEAICTVLAPSFRVRTNIKNYNNELGVPLSIIGAPSGRRSVVGWLRVFLRAARLLLFRDERYPQMLVLEMGADHPGDLAYLTSLAPCTVGVLTAIAPAHTEYFGSIEAVQQEKSVIILHVPKDGRAVVNVDDERVTSVATQSPAPVLGYGFSERATVRALSTTLSAGEGMSALPKGVSVVVGYNNQKQEVFLPGVVGRHQAYAPLAAIAVGLHFGIDLAASAAALRAYHPPAGRLTLIPGVKHSIVLDDSYNSSPVAAFAALETLFSLPAPRKIACLGDMAELGPLSEASHRDVGERCSQLGLALLITVGPKAKTIHDAALAKGFAPDRAHWFATSAEAGIFLQAHLHEGDAVLVKGSQVARTEKIVKEVMADPARAHELLVRQGPEWQNGS